MAGAVMFDYVARLRAKAQKVEDLVRALSVRSMTLTGINERIDIYNPRGKVLACVTLDDAGRYTIVPTDSPWAAGLQPVARQGLTLGALLTVLEFAQLVGDMAESIKKAA